MNDSLNLDTTKFKEEFEKLKKDYQDLGGDSQATTESILLGLMNEKTVDEVVTQTSKHSTTHSESDGSIANSELEVNLDKLGHQIDDASRPNKFIRNYRKHVERPLLTTGFAIGFAVFLPISLIVAGGAMFYDAMNSESSDSKTYERLGKILGPSHHAAKEVEKFFGTGSDLENLKKRVKEVSKYEGKFLILEERIRRSKLDISQKKSLLDDAGAIKKFNKKNYKAILDKFINANSDNNFLTVAKKTLVDAIGDSNYENKTKKELTEQINQIKNKNELEQLRDKLSMEGGYEDFIEYSITPCLIAMDRF
jgi:hypothetical protein